MSLEYFFFVSLPVTHAASMPGKRGGWMSFTAGVTAAKVIRTLRARKKTLFELAP